MVSVYSSQVASIPGTTYAGRNEDCGLVTLNKSQNALIFCLADAHGGSFDNSLGVDCARAVCSRAEKYLKDWGRKDALMSTVMHGAFHEASNAADAFKEHATVGSTLLCGTAAIMANAPHSPRIAVSLGVVGDSRVVLWRKGKIIARTETHTCKNKREHFRLYGAKNVHISKHRLCTPLATLEPSRALGHKHVLSFPETYQWSMAEGDVLVAGTDGVFNVLSMMEIADLITYEDDPGAVAKRLIKKIVETSPSFYDNSSVIVWTARGG